MRVLLLLPINRIQVWTLTLTKTLNLILLINLKIFFSVLQTGFGKNQVCKIFIESSLISTNLNKSMPNQNIFIQKLHSEILFSFCFNLISSVIVWSLLLTCTSYIFILKKYSRQFLKLFLNLLWKIFFLYKFVEWLKYNN